MEQNSVFDVRACYVEGRLNLKNNREYSLVNISPPIQQDYGDKDIDKVVMTPRFVGSTLFPINEWPMYVHVCQILNEEAIKTDTASKDDLTILLWGTLYKSFDEANNETEEYAKQLERHYGKKPYHR